jgi:ketosteroid isomerase-like protein
MTLEDLEKRVKAAEEELKVLRKRLTVQEDVEEIKKIQVTYVNALMATDWDKTTDCFSDNARINVYLHDPVQGRKAIEKFFKEELAVTHAGKEGDVCIHPIITVDGDKAKGSWLLYMMYFYPRTGQSLFWVQGYYEMEYVREKGKWKIDYMSWTERLGLPGSGPPTGLW